MPEDTHLVGARAKIDRARRHLLELTSDIQEFQSAHHYEVIEEADPHTGDWVYRVRIDQDIPLEWGAIVGDVIHNLRSALDFGAWQLVCAAGGTPNRATAFPITEKTEIFGLEANHRLQGASPQAMRLIKHLRPYSGGNEALWTLHQLDIIDKHRLLLPVGLAHRPGRFSCTIRVNDGEPIESPPPPISPKDELFPLKDGMELFRVNAGASEQELSPFTFTFDIAFGDGQVVDGEPVLLALKQPTV